MRQKSIEQMQFEANLPEDISFGDLSFARFNQWIDENVIRSSPNLRGTDLWA